MSALFSRLSKEKQLKLAFWKVKEELNEHLDTINQNTDEISESFESIARLEQKLDEMEARLERLEVEKGAQKSLIALSLREQEVFAMLYLAQKRMTLREISNALSLDQDVVNTILSNLIAKGIPVLKQATDEIISLYLEKGFKDNHAKKPVVHLSQQVLATIQDA